MLGFGNNSSLPSKEAAYAHKDAHEALTRSRTSMVVQLSSGDQISYSQVGDSNGIPCIWINGPSANRFLVCLYDKICTETGIKLYCFDRPGRGASSQVRNPKEWTFSKYGEILNEITDILEIPKFYVVAHSFGTSYALSAYPLLKPKIIGAFRFLATWAPSNLPCMPSSYALQRSLPTKIFRTLTSIAQSPTISSYASSVPCQMGRIGSREADIIDNLYNKEVLDRVAHDHLAESYKAYEMDWMLALEVTHKFGFDHRLLKCAVKCWHGMDDTITPLGAAMWMQREMDHFLLYAVEGATHNIHLDMSIVKAVFADISADHLARMAKAAEKNAAADASTDSAVGESTAQENSQSNGNSTSKE